MAARRNALLVVALAALLLPASASGASYSTKIVVSLRVPAFHGILKSSKSSCSKGRLVQIFRVRSGPDKLLGADRSDAKRKWSVPLGKRLASGASYYAKASAKGKCRSAKSGVIEIG